MPSFPAQSKLNNFKTYNFKTKKKLENQRKNAACKKDYFLWLSTNISLRFIN